MKTVSVIVASRESLQSAGARIRYIRLSPFFKDYGYRFDIIPISDVGIDYIRNKEIVIISKVFTSKAIDILVHCKDLGIKAGVDIFDDYFSDATLTPFTFQRDWLTVAAKWSSFLLCTTTRMKEVCSQYINNNYIKQLNDTRAPYPSWTLTEYLLKKKSEQRKSSNHIHLLWFGIGDNPYYEIGIQDLYFYSNCLMRLRRSNKKLSLTILTNERALTHQNLSMISRLPIASTVELWSEEEEANALEKTDIALMPVSHQRFSMGKSNNRCMTAMSYGCQVLSTGHNLYSEFEDFIYRSTADLMVDTEQESYKFNVRSLSKFISICEASLAPKKEVGSFLEFTTELPLGQPVQERSALAFIHFTKTRQFVSGNTNKNIISLDWTLAKTCPTDSMWIAKHDGKYFIEMKKQAYQVLSTNAKIFSPDKTESKDFRISINDVRPILGDDRVIHRLLKFRFQKRGSQPQHMIEGRVAFTYVYPDICFLLTFLWGTQDIFIINPKSLFTHA